MIQLKKCISLRLKKNNNIWDKVIGVINNSKY